MAVGTMHADQERGRLLRMMSRLALCALLGHAPDRAAAQDAGPGRTSTENVLMDRLAKAALFTETGAPAGPSSFAGLRGKVVFLDIWAAWCESCLLSLPKIETIYRMTRTRPALAFLSVHDGRWEQRNRPPAFLTAHGCDYDTFIDAHKNFTDLYDWIPLVNSLPKYILIGQDGRIVKRYGEDDLQQVQADMIKLGGLPAASQLPR